MRDDSDEKPCISFSVREIQPGTKSANARVEEELGVRPFDPAPTAMMEGWRTRLWPFTPRVEPTISYGGPVAGEKFNLCYTFGMTNGEEPVEKALMASSSAAITSEDSVILLRPSRFLLPGSYAGRYGGRRAARPCH